MTALAGLVNAQFCQPFAENWGDGTNSSSDGRPFRAGGQAESTGHINPKCGTEPGKFFHTHISNKYVLFSTKVVKVGLLDSICVPGGLPHQESELAVQKNYTDTAGFTDHVFAQMHLLGLRFAPRIRDLGNTKLHIPKGSAYQALQPMIGGVLKLKVIQAHLDDILRPTTSIKPGMVTASLILRNLGSYPHQDGPAVALRKLGQIGRTPFTLDWLQSVERKYRLVRRRG